MTSQIKTFILLAVLSGLLIVIGGALGGRIGLIIAFGLALFMNIWSYWYSDSFVLRMYNAEPLSFDEAPMIHTMVEELAQSAGIPKPRIVVIPEDAPNAFATGRDPEHSVVAITEGIIRILSTEELKGVLAHEVAHIANRDILIQTVASVIGSTIVSIANLLQFTAIFGFGQHNEDGENSNPLVVLAMVLLAPIAATIIQFAISRSREYLADATGAKFTGKPLALAGALEKLSNWNQRVPMQQGNPSISELFIVAPLFNGNMATLFSTHPDIHDRVMRLRSMVQRSHN